MRHRNSLVFDVKAYRATHNSDWCNIYNQRHHDSLADFGIENVTSNNGRWVKNPNIYCTILTEHRTQEVLGGIRIQVADNQLPLPIEEAIGKNCPEIGQHIGQKASNGGLGELSGLWVAKKMRGLGLSNYLAWASLSTTNQINIRSITGICAQYSFRFFQGIGFVADTNFRNNGKIPYPNHRYQSYVVNIPELIEFKSAAEHQRERIMELRKTPVCSKVEAFNGSSCKVNYYLKYQ